MGGCPLRRRRRRGPAACSTTSVRRVLFRAGRRFDASPAIAPPRPPVFLFFGLRPAAGLVWLFLVLVGIGFLRWLVVGEQRWRADRPAGRLRRGGPVDLLRALLSARLQFLRVLLSAVLGLVLDV